MPCYKSLKRRVISTFNLDKWGCLSLKDLLVKDCLDCGFMPTEPFEAAASVFFPSLLFFTKADEKLFDFESFSFLLVPLPLGGLDSREVSATFTFPT